MAMPRDGQRDSRTEMIGSDSGQLTFREDNQDQAERCKVKSEIIYNSEEFLWIS